MDSIDLAVVASCFGFAAFIDWRVEKCMLSCLCQHSSWLPVYGLRCVLLYIGTLSYLHDIGISRHIALYFIMVLISFSSLFKANIRTQFREFLWIYTIISIRNGIMINLNQSLNFLQRTHSGYVFAISIFLPIVLCKKSLYFLIRFRPWLYALRTLFFVLARFLWFNGMESYPNFPQCTSIVMSCTIPGFALYLSPFFMRYNTGSSETLLQVPETRATKTLDSTNTRNVTILKRCNVCYDSDVKGVILACKHPYCMDCLRKLFKTAIRDSSILPLRCCEIPIDTTISSALLPSHEVEILTRRTAEIKAKRKVYCPRCQAFLNLDIIPSSMVNILCSCGAEICTKCQTLTHPPWPCYFNQRKKNDGEKEIIKLAEEQGWKRCPKCSNMIELTYGCNHMTCRCGHGFCYLCLRPWDTRSGNCSSGRCSMWNENRLLEAAELRVGHQLGQRAVPQMQRETLVQREVDALQQNEICVHRWTRRNVRNRECERCTYPLYIYAMFCEGGCRSMVCHTCAHHRIPTRGWR